MKWIGIRIRHLLRWCGMDPAVFWGSAGSVWQVLSAPVTMLLITRYMTAETQGFYYSFGSILGLQSFIELGLYVVIVNLASHEWANLRLEKGHIVGQPAAFSRLVSLGRFVGKWYAVGSILFAVCVGMAGQIFFSLKREGQVSWTFPWWLLVGLSSLLFWTLPLSSLLEGCNQVATIQRFRLNQLVLRSLAMWLVLGIGGGLWALVISAAVGIMRDAYLLGVQYRLFFRSFFRQPAGPVISWRSEVLPMQSRLAIEGVFGYFFFQSFNPVMFHYHGPITAGQMGMTLSVISAVQGFAYKWMQPKIPVFGMLIAAKNYSELNHLWSRTARISLIVAGSCAMVAWFAIYTLNKYKIPLAARLLPPVPSAIFLVSSVFLAMDFCLTAYLRAHKQEPILLMSIVTSILMGLLVWALGKQFGPLGASIAYLLVVGGVTLPWELAIWFRCRAKWHQA